MVAVAERARLQRRGVLLEWFTVTWNVVEAAVAITAGVVAGSVALVGFGVDGVLKPYGKTDRSRRAVPLSDRALAALDALPARLDGKLVAAPEGGYLSLRNWRRREWRPAMQAAGLALCKTCGHDSGEHEPGAGCEGEGCRCKRFVYDTGAA